MIEVAAAAALALGTTLPAGAAQLADSEARQMAEKLLGAINKAEHDRNASQLGSLFAADAIKVYPKGSMRGRAAIEQFYADMLTDRSYEGAPSTLGDVKAAGDNVILIAGQWSGTWSGPKGPVPMNGRWTMTYVRDGDTWKIAMETANVAPGQ